MNGPGKVLPADILRVVAKWLSDAPADDDHAVNLRRNANGLLEHLATPNSGLPSDEDLAVAVLEVLRTNGQRHRVPAISKGVAGRLNVPVSVAEQGGPPWVGWHSEGQGPLVRTAKPLSLLEYRVGLVLDVMRRFGWARKVEAKKRPKPWIITETGAGIAPEDAARQLVDDWQFRHRSLDHWKLEPWMIDWYDRMVPLFGGGGAFELLCSDILSWNGRFDVHVRGGSRDGGLDIEIRDEQRRRRHFAQCKGYVRGEYVNHKQVREMPGAVSAEVRKDRDAGGEYDAGYALIMTTGELTTDWLDESAWQFADDHFDEFIVVDGKRLLELVRQTEVGIIVHSHDDIVVDEAYFEELAERAGKKIDC